MMQQDVSYRFTPGRRSVLAEIYFPRRIATQGTIYKALEKGLNIEIVRAYLRTNAARIFSELTVYSHWFDPNRYGETKIYNDPLEAAKTRMNMCQQVFYGWSMYEVDGVFLKRDGIAIDEERTQVIKLMFKYEDEELERQTREASYPDIFRAVLYRVLSQYGEADDYIHWSEDELRLFLFRHASWPKEKLDYAEVMFPAIAKSIGKWIDDSGLFIFGYLVRQFWTEIVRLHRGGAPLEDEIWATSVFHMDINVLSPIRPISEGEENE